MESYGPPCTFQKALGSIKIHYLKLTGDETWSLIYIPGCAGPLEDGKVELAVYPVVAADVPAAELSLTEPQ